MKTTMKKVLLTVLLVLTCSFACSSMVTAAPKAKKASKVSVKLVYADSQHFNYYYKYTGRTSSGKKVWTYKTSVQPCAQLTNFKPKPIVKNNLVYVLDGDRIVALKKTTGKVMWKTPAGTIATITDHCFDSKGNFYACGYLGPDLVKINKKGKVLFKVESVTPKLWWPYDLKIKGKNIQITYEAPKTKKIQVRMSDGKRVK